MVDNRRWVDAIRELQEESLIHNLSPIGPDAVQDNQEDGATDEQKAHHITNCEFIEDRHDVIPWKASAARTPSKKESKQKATDSSYPERISSQVIERREGVDGVLCFCNMS